MEGCDVLLNFVYMQSTGNIKEILFVKLDQQSESSIQQQWTRLGNKPLRQRMKQETIVRDGGVNQYFEYPQVVGVLTV